MKSKKIVALLLAAIMILLIAACGASGDGGSTTTPDGGESTTTPSGNDSATTPGGDSTSPNPVTPSADPNAAIKGGTLNIAGELSTTLAWYDIRGIMWVANMGYFYEPIMRYTSDGKAEPFLIESATPDSDALTWTLVVRDGIMFSDGSPLDAEALAWNLDFYKERGVLSSSFFMNYTHAEALADGKTVVCHFDNWDALFDYSLCRTVLVASKVAFDTHGEEWLVQNPVGTGPFILAEMNADVNMHMTRNDNYWQGEVYLDEVNMTAFAEQLIAATSIQTGDIHVMTTDDYALMAQMESTNLQKFPVDVPSYAYTLTFNSVDPNDPFYHKEVREAVSYAIDVQTIKNTVTYGYAQSTNQWAMPDSPFYSTDVQGQPFDLEKAKQLLADAGYPDGFTTRLTYNSMGGSILMSGTVQSIQEQLAAIGVIVELQPIDPSAYVNYIGGWEEGMLLHTMGMESGAASQYATTFIRPVGFALGVNAIAVSDELNALSQSITSSPTIDELNARTREVAKIVFEDEVLVKVVLVTSNMTYMRPEVSNCRYGIVQALRSDIWDTWLAQ